jgi:endonuclease III
MPRESFTSKQIRAKLIFNLLIKHHPFLSTFLTHKNSFELLIAVILSAQCTDERVNLTTPKLFEAFPTPEALAVADIAKVERLIKSVNYYRTKSKNIIHTGKLLVEKFNGEVPNTMDALITLPGVGRKTANVMLGQAFGKPGITVDTHVRRLVKRLGFSTHNDATLIEYDLQKSWPVELWTDLSTHLIYHGRQICSPRKPECSACIIQEQCPKILNL